MTEINLDFIVNEVIKRLMEKNDNKILVEASGRHIHLSTGHLEILFGKGYKLTPKKELSQPGQFLSEEKVSLTGSEGTIENISILGPVREKSQAEISKTDALSIGVSAPVRMSGNIEGSGSAIISTPLSSVKLQQGVIVAKRHIHITPEDAGKFGVSNNEEVNVKVEGERGVIFTNVSVRVSKDYCTALHLDYDEANACGYYKGMKATIVKQQ